MDVCGGEKISSDREFNSGPSMPYPPHYTDLRAMDISKLSLTVIICGDFPCVRMDLRHCSTYRLLIQYMKNLSTVIREVSLRHIVKD